MPASTPAFSMPPLPSDHVLMTVFLRQDQSKPLPRLLEEMEANGFLSHFPPPGITVVSWLNLPSFGQVVILKVPPARLREVNVAIETHAWGAYRTEVHLAYDFMDAARELHARAFAQPIPVADEASR